MSKLVIYHGDCADGFTAAWCVRKKFPDADFVTAVYNKQPPPDVMGREVIIVDFSYPRAILEEMAGKADSLLVLDHHKTAQQDLEGLSYCVFDMARSGATLAWDYFHPDQPRPALVKYVEDRDLWRWGYNNSKEVNASIMSWPRTFEKWDELHLRLETKLESVIDEGSALLRAQDQQLAFVLKNARKVTFAGYEVMAVNTSVLHSEAANKLAEGAHFGIAWSQKADGKFTYSLRVSQKSLNPEIDVAAICKTFGGGGHPAAAGCSADTLLF